VWNVWWRRKIYTRFGGGTVKERDRSEIAGRKISEWFVKI
jgi:hypothetical protein